MNRWTDNPATNTVRIQAVHINELRTFINTLRSTFGLPAFNWSDGATVGTTIHIRAVHFTEMRTAIQDLWTYKSMGTIPNWSYGSAPSSSRVISARDINDLRNWVDQVDPQCGEVCVGSNYNVHYSDCGQSFTGGIIAYDINQVAVAHGINPATLATITSMETESLTGSTSNNYGCSNCDQGGAGATQIGINVFNNWNLSASGGPYTFCADICGIPGSSQLRRNLDICAEYLKAGFDAATAHGGYNEIQKMAAIATTWNRGGSCGSTGSYFYPYTPAPPATGYPLAGTNQMSTYGSTAGNLFQNSGLVGSGVYDTSQLLPT